MSLIEEHYQKMLTIRLLETRLQAYCDRGEAGDLHFNKGQEAIAVGVCVALGKDDRIVVHHRTIAHQVAKGADLYPLVAELLGKRTGVNGGRAGEMHISDRKIGHDFSFQLVGTCIPVAAGLAWALKNYRRTKQVVAVFFGDAASANGQFHEGLSLAKIHSLPILLVCENNNLAGNITPDHYMPVPSVSVRAAAYGISALTGDGNDIADVIKVTKHALDTVRAGRPTLIEFNTTRLCWHKQGQRDVRSADVLAELAKRDPLRRLAEVISAETAARLNSEIGADLDRVFARVDADSPPEVFHD